MYDENNLQILNSLGRLFHEKENQAGRKIFLKALKIDENSFQIINNLAGFYREEENIIKQSNFMKKL